MKSKTKKLFLTLFAFASLSLAACGGGNESSAAPSGGDSSSQSSSESSSEGSSSGESSSEEVDPNVVNAAKFAEVVTEYGCFSGSATYDAELASGTDEMDLKLEIQNGKIKQTETSGDEERSIYLEVKVNETTTETEIVRYYQSNSTWYKTPASEFIGFTYEYGEYGVAFDQLDFTDFEYNATTKEYALKQEVVLDYDDGDLVVTYKSLSFKFENNNIVNVDATYEIGVDDPFEATLSITGSKFGTTTVTLPQAEDEPVGPTPPEPGPGPAVVVPPCIHLGRGSAWNDIQLNLKKEDADPDNPEYFAQYHFEKDDVFKINFDDNNEHWRGYTDLKPSSPARWYFEEDTSNEDHNFKVKYSGTYTIYVATNAPDSGTDAGKYVYIYGAPDNPVAIPPCIHLCRNEVWSDVQLNLKTEEADPENPEYFAQYQFNQNDVFKINFDGEVAHWRGYTDLKPSSPAKDCFVETESDNNFKVLFAGTYTIYVVTNAPGEGTDAGKYVYITGSPTNPTITYSVTVNEAPAAAHTVYAHVWKEDGTLNPAKQQDAVATVSGTTVTFTVNVTGQYDKVVIAELKDDQTTLGDDWVNVLRQTDSAALVDEGNYSWETESTIPAHTMRIFNTDTNCAMTAKNEGAEYYITNVHLNENDVFKFKVDGDDWRGSDGFKTVNVGDRSVHNNFEDAGSDTNIKCKVEGYYDFFVATDKNADGSNPGKSIYVRQHFDSSGWKAIINGSTEVPIPASTNVDKDTEITLTRALNENDTIIFENSDGSVKQGYDQCKDGCATIERFDKVAATNSFKVKTGCDGTYHFYIDLTLAKGVWIEKEGESVVTINGNSWVFGDSPDFFLHLEDNDSHSTDIKLSFAHEHSCFVNLTLDWTPTECKVYRCKPGAAAPVATTDDVAGRIWNTSNTVSWGTNVSVTIS